MIISRILSPIHSLGPGERICVWTQGCSKRCFGCISPEMQPFSGKNIEESILADVILKVAENNKCTGLTISGGDPFEQSRALLELLKRTRSYFEDILVYTGFEISEIYDGLAGEYGIECLRYIDVLIDGKYCEELNECDCILRGSKNQKIHFINEKKAVIYNEYMKSGRIIETFVHNGDTIITGILNREY